MELFGHIISRGFLHFICSPFVVMSLFFFLNFLGRKLRNPVIHSFLSERYGVTLVICVILTCLLVFFREPGDVASGQPLVKAYTDFFSWFSGSSVSAWGIYRLIRMEWN